MLAKKEYIISITKSKSQETKNELVNQNHKTVTQISDRVS
jgi:hypothetical protein